MDAAGAPPTRREGSCTTATTNGAGRRRRGPLWKRDAGGSRRQIHGRADAKAARKAPVQAALDLQAKEGDAEYEKMKPPPPNGGYEEPSEEVLKMRETMEKVFMATLTDPHYQKHPVPMVRSQHSHDTCKELLDLCKLPEGGTPATAHHQEDRASSGGSRTTWVRAAAGSAAKAFGIKEVADDFDEELRRKFGHFCRMRTGRGLGGGTRSDFEDRWKSAPVLPPLPEFEKHCNFRTDEEIAELMAHGGPLPVNQRLVTWPQARAAVVFRAAGPGTRSIRRQAASSRRVCAEGRRVMLDDAPEIKPVGNCVEIKFWAPH